MSTYMLALKTNTGYESLKTKYMRQLARNFPDIQGEPNSLDNTLAGDMENVDDDDYHDREVSLGILPINPIVEIDKKIEELAICRLPLPSRDKACRPLQTFRSGS